MAPGEDALSGVIVCKMSWVFVYLAISSIGMSVSQENTLFLKSLVLYSSFT